MTERELLAAKARLDAIRRTRELTITEEYQLIDINYQLTGIYNQQTEAIARQMAHDQDVTQKRWLGIGVVLVGGVVLWGAFKGK